MKSYEIVFTKSALKEIQSIENKLVENIFFRIERLSQNPRPAGCIKLQGNNKLWRLRIGKYRIIYSIDDDSCLIDLIAIRHRKEAYN